MDYLKMARNKRDMRNTIRENEYYLPIEDFLMISYTRCEPNVYGNRFVKKLMVDLPELCIVPKKMDLGDVTISNKKYFECKISYGDKSGYNLRNIRSYQNFDYFIICFVDSYNDFKPKFYCVEKWVITDNSEISICNMHGTINANKKNTNILKSVTIRKEDVTYILGNNNLLKGTTYKNLLAFLKKNG